MRKFEIFDPTALSSPATAESAIESRSDWPSGGASTASLAHKLAMNCAALAEFGTRYLALRPEMTDRVLLKPAPERLRSGDAAYSISDWKKRDLRAGRGSGSATGRCGFRV